MKYRPAPRVRIVHAPVYPVWCGWCGADMEPRDTPQTRPKTCSRDCRDAYQADASKRWAEEYRKKREGADA